MGCKLPRAATAHLNEPRNQLSVQIVSRLRRRNVDARVVRTIRLSQWSCG